jgi:tetratricopeptide (TPR) repeat protein
MHPASILSLLFPVVVLTACSHTPPASVPVTDGPAAATPAVRPEASATMPEAPLPVPPALSYRPPTSAQASRPLADGSQLPAVQGLLSAADRAVRKGDLELAAVSLERAQRLAPQSAAVYQRFADVRLRQKRPAEAEQLARKALAYTAVPAQQAQLWRQIAAARQQQGQMPLAQEALQRALALEAAGVAR